MNHHLFELGLFKVSTKDKSTPLLCAIPLRLIESFTSPNQLPLITIVFVKKALTVLSVFQGDLGRQNGCSYFCALKWCGHTYTSVLQQKLGETGDLMYPDLGHLQHTGVFWEKDNKKSGSEA